MPFDLLPAFFMAVLACWLGLSLLVRAPRDRVAQTFAWLCLHLTIYGLTITLSWLTNSAQVVRPTLYRLEMVETALLPPVFLHFSMVVAIQRSIRAQWVLLALIYAVGVGLAGYALFSPYMLLSAAPPRFPNGPLVLVSIVQRVFPLLLALFLSFLRYQTAHEDVQDWGHRAFFALTLTIAVAGAFLASAARELQFSQAPGHLLMDTGLAMLAYMVLAYRMLLPARVAQRTFYRSLIGGVLTAVYIVTLLVIEPLVSRTLQIDTPLITVFAIVVLIALFGPLRDAGSAQLDRRFFHREFDYGQLLGAVNEDLVERGELSERLEAALAAICRTLRVRSGAVAVQEDTGLRMIATYGTETPLEIAFKDVVVPDQPQTYHDDWEPWPVARLLLPLRSNQDSLGLLVLGSKRSGEPYQEVERLLLDSLGRHLAQEIKHARSQQEIELTMAAVVEQSRQLETAEQALAAQVAEHEQRVAVRETAPVAQADGLRVYALGPLRVEHGGKLIERWGGDKAGTYQAEALFAFLFDRRGRGLTKDEVEEVVWPDLDLKALDKADTAFHRTLSGLRRTLEPGLRRGNESRLITYHHERYWLDPAAIGWCDVDQFAALTERGYTLVRQGDLEGALESFRVATVLYRDDYMYDCPFFGDSAYVEERREELREQCVNALLSLGSVYERLGQAGEASTAFRRALTLSRDGCPRAEEALARLQVDVMP